MKEELIKIIAEELSVDEADVTMEANLQDDLGADSLDTVELVMALEEEFGRFRSVFPAAEELERRREKILYDLDTEEPVSANVEIWLGKVADALGEVQDAAFLGGEHLRRTDVHGAADPVDKETDGGHGGDRDGDRGCKHP